MSVQQFAKLSKPMSVNSISFWQQDANYWNRSVRRDQALANSDALITAMGSAMTNLASGLASIANQTALNRVNSQIAALAKNAAPSSSGSSTSSSSSSSSSGSPNSSGSSNSSKLPATGTGTVPLAMSASLITLGIPATGTISVSDGANTTTYTSTGTDTVADLVNAINANVSGNAYVSASFNSIGELVVTSKDATDTVTVGGTYASAVGFGLKNNTFQPSNLSSSRSSTSSPSSSSSSSSSSPSAASSPSGTNGSTGSSAATSTSSSSGIPQNSSSALLTGGTAETLLASNGAVGDVLDLFA